MTISWMTLTSNIEHWSPSSPVLASFTVHVSDVGRRWVATRPTSSLMQVGSDFERMLWWCWLPTTVDFAAWPNADRGQAFNERLASALSARPGGRHYAKGCLHLQIPGDCLVIDGISAPHDDIVVDIAPIGTYTNRKSVVMVRNLLSPELEQMYWGGQTRVMSVPCIRLERESC
jgi:hypothetical protein